MVTSYDSQTIILVVFVIAVVTLLTLGLAWSIVTLIANRKSLNSYWLNRIMETEIFATVLIILGLSIMAFIEYENSLGGPIDPIIYRNVPRGVLLLFSIGSNYQVYAFIGNPLKDQLYDKHSFMVEKPVVFTLQVFNIIIQIGATVMIFIASEGNTDWSDAELVLVTAIGTILVVNIMIEHFLAMIPLENASRNHRHRQPSPPPPPGLKSKLDSLRASIVLQVLTAGGLLALFVVQANDPVNYSPDIANVPGNLQSITESKAQALRVGIVMLMITYGLLHGIFFFAGRKYEPMLSLMNEGDYYPIVELSSQALPSPSNPVIVASTPPPPLPSSGLPISGISYLN